ncbi:uncharacterized protein LOC100904698 [Galendromus occidentalis]|uniref:Uncharacterized protein LOC100904698 n=1 Tax=Galendromus occidentalis TaxID=34638 RepID=A0AAJ6QNL3_9ACAR|nr:uncharacterized protein LOC100904698 [Galendromus occidentalis]
MSDIVRVPKPYDDDHWDERPRCIQQCGTPEESEIEPSHVLSFGASSFTEESDSETFESSEVSFSSRDYRSSSGGEDCQSNLSGRFVDSMSVIEVLLSNVDVSGFPHYSNPDLAQRLVSQSVVLAPGSRFFRHGRYALLDEEALTASFATAVCLKLNKLLPREDPVAELNLSKMSNEALGSLLQCLRRFVSREDFEHSRSLEWVEQNDESKEDGSRSPKRLWKSSDKGARYDLALSDG